MPIDVNGAPHVANMQDGDMFFIEVNIPDPAPDHIVVRGSTISGDTANFALAECQDWNTPVTSAIGIDATGHYHGTLLDTSAAAGAISFLVTFSGASERIVTIEAKTPETVNSTFGEQLTFSPLDPGSFAVFKFNASNLSEISHDLHGAPAKTGMGWALAYKAGDRFSLFAVPDINAGPREVSPAYTGELNVIIAGQDHPMVTGDNTIGFNGPITINAGPAGASPVAPQPPAPAELIHGIKVIESADYPSWRRN